MPDNGAYVQSQDSLREQVLRVLALAVEHGEYDAADFLSRAYFGENTPGWKFTHDARNAR